MPTKPTDPTQPPPPALALLERAVVLVEEGDAGAHLEAEARAAWRVLQATNPAAVARLKARLRKAKADTRALAAVLKPPAGRGPLHPAGDDAPPPTVADVLPGCPAPGGLLLPPDYLISPAGIAKRQHSAAGPYLQPVASAPVVLCAVLASDGGLERWRVAWKRCEHWHVHTEARGAYLDPRRLLALADAGAPVWGGSAPALAEYLHDFEAANRGRLPTAAVSDALGWQGEHGSKGFLCGRDLLTPAGASVEVAALDTLAPSAWAADRVYFDPAGPGDAQLAESLSTSGTFEGWRAAVATACPGHPRAALALYAALAAPLLAVVRDVPNFAVDWSFPTSTGKTTVLRIAASVWGRPADGAADSFIHSWDATKVWIERAASTLNGIPLLLDESQRVKKAADVAEIIYGFSQGQGRGRGVRTEGTRKTRAFRSLLLSTGEKPLVSFAEAGGVRARVLTLWGPPFGKTSLETGRMVLRLKCALAEHHGHAGRRFVAWLLSQRDHWPEYRATWGKLLAVYTDRAGADPVAGRLCEPMAFLHLAAHLAHIALDLPWACEDPFSTLWAGLTAEASEADRAAEALRVACGWALSNSASFCGRHQEGINGPFVPAGGWAGRWDRDDWEYLGFFPEKLGRVLRESDFDPDSAVRTWKAKGWTVTEGQYLTTKIRGPWGGKTSERARMVAIRREAFENVYLGKEDAEASGDEAAPGR